MKQAIVATEDKRFYQHRGIDIRGMARALWTDIRAQGRVQGGSTITQQFVKNALTGNHRSVFRKLKEAALAWQLEQKWPKDRILTAYLNTIYFGNGAYGVERAARTYFGHGAAEADALGGGAARRHPRGPEPLRPGRAPAGGEGPADDRAPADARSSTSSTPAQFRRAVHDADAEAAGRPPLRRPGLGAVLRRVREGAAHRPLRREAGLRQRLPRLHDDQPQAAGPRAAAIQKWLPSADGPQAALVAINPTDGSVLAMDGGRNFHVSQYNLATRASGRPGRRSSRSCSRPRCARGSRR